MLNVNSRLFVHYGGPITFGSLLDRPMVVAFSDINTINSIFEDRRPVDDLRGEVILNKGSVEWGIIHDERLTPRERLRRLDTLFEGGEGIGFWGSL